MNDSITPITTTSSGRMVEFLCSLTADNLPAAVIREARNRLLDGLGCGLYGATLPWGRIAAQVVYEEKSQGRATIYGNRGTVAPARAALVNGTATHGIELDDIAPGHAHPGAVVIPAVLAAAEQYELPGMRVLLGLIAGYEATSRVGTSIGEVGWGFYLPSIVGVVGATVACGVTLGMSHEQLMRAVGIACSSAAGIRSFIQGSGGMVKRLHAGRAAESGVLACLLARRGFTAPLAALDGKFGLLEVFGGDNTDSQRLDSKLGESYVMSRVLTKMYPCCGALHTMAQALSALRVEHGLEHGAIKSVRVGVDHRAVELHTEVSPRETMAAQYSMPFTAAVALVGDPMDPRSYIGDALNNPAVCDLARRVVLHLDPEIDAVYPRHGAHVEVQLTSGRTLDATVLDAKGSPSNPCSEDELKEKFRCLASASITDDSIVKVLSLVERIETLPSVALLSDALRTGIRA